MDDVPWYIIGHLDEAPAGYSKCSRDSGKQMQIVFVSCIDGPRLKVKIPNGIKEKRFDINQEEADIVYISCTSIIRLQKVQP